MQHSTAKASLCRTSDGHATQHDIDQELTSNDSHRLILHDSRGLAGGAIENLRTAQEFIKRSAEMAFKDRLHAIWIPIPGGRLFERGNGMLLQNLANEVQRPIENLTMNSIVDAPTKTGPKTQTATGEATGDSEQPILGT
ncbi:hypothetical protein BS47DRAFT_1356472 [Hydnum rufescens UP504]|uniref:Uncharacterized protein n=1 Tax=Hydnum rufescens UP504 TaxID=1448309 RepID=A0A9P6DLB3_9AGAM|nr:hypothetical protein BS47DRAFT_1356472 [Hydnum rufescens UP504]